MKIGELEVVRDSRQVLRDGVAVRLGSRAFDLLQLLLDANGAVIPTDEILAKVWPSTVVEENNIQVHICALRRLLGENRHLIQTVSGRGYMMARPKAVVVDTLPASSNAHPAALPEPDLSLPLENGPLYGRETCVDRLTSTIAEGDHAVITLAGPAGVGKSRLALEVARRFAGLGEISVSYLSLAARSSEREAYDLIGAALEPRGDTESRTAETRTSGPTALLVIDNCDRLAGAVIQALSDSATFRQLSRTVVLLTTRTPLRVSMEKVIKIPSLLAVPPRGAVNAALDMFVSRVRCFDPQIDTDDVFLERARHVVEQMDGLPLAIELAAHHTSMLGIESVSLLLEQNIDLSGSDVRRMTESRHASLSAALMWTWAELGASPRTILTGLLDAGVEAGLRELRSIAERAGLPQESALQAISDLADSSFVVRAYTGSSVTYRIPNTVRRFLWQQRQVVPTSRVPTMAGLRSPLRIRPDKPGDVNTDVSTGNSGGHAVSHKRHAAPSVAVDDIAWPRSNM
ncbi:winged helix-turn-helix domain-containing protein [Paraburkholderia aromaticivorans]|uniref:winged helix-turn-helix domain-containing protein n=1 Tax=Paraburkholderia aromaticivorans TaxID=2026199 RepID=UPI0038B7F323